MKTAAILSFLILTFFNSFGQLPDFMINDLNNNRVFLNDLKGEKLTVFDFWATWCKPCISSIPKLNLIYQNFSNKGVEIIGVNVDGPRNISKVKPFATSLNVKYPIVLDTDQDLTNEFNITVFPTLIVLNEKGEKVFTHEGFNSGDEQIIVAELNRLLGK